MKLIGSFIALAVGLSLYGQSAQQQLLISQEISASTPSAFAAWGDSLTMGNQDGSGGTYPATMATLMGRAVFNGGVGGQTSSQVATRMLADTAKFGDNIVIEVGRNDLFDGSYSQSLVLSNIASMIASLTNPTHFAVVSCINADAAGSEYVGDSTYNTIIALNNAMKAAWPNNYLDLRELAVQSYNASDAQDVIDFGQDVPPSSLRAHFTGGSLSGALNNSATSFTITLPGQSLLFNGDTIIIDSEKIYAGSISGSGPFTITGGVRSYAGTSAVSHLNGATTSAIDSTHLSGAGYAIWGTALSQFFQNNGFVR